MSTKITHGIVERALEDGSGVLRLEPTWVARDFLPPGKRLGLPEESYDLGERGAICERWLGSTTKADNSTGPADEGLSYLALDSDDRVTLKTAVETCPKEILGKEYAAAHPGLGRLAKVFDYAARLPYHIHPRAQHTALVGRKPKEEAYYFPEGVDMGPHPETFFGVHPWIAEQKAYDTLLPYLVEWNSDRILRHAWAELQVPGEGFQLPSGTLHAPGTALTIELQEDSDVFAMLQALNAGRIIPKELLFKDVRAEDRARYGERFILEMIDWETSGDPYFYENRHLTPRLIEKSRQKGGEEYWIYYNSTKFSGKKLVVHAGQTYNTLDRGVYNIFVLGGVGRYGGQSVEGGAPGLDELLITHARATKPLTVENAGRDDLVIIKFFGPDINTDQPFIPSHPRQ